MTEKSPLDQALDLFVYAPLGLALTARDELPKLIERGRAEVQAQTTMARTVGKFAVSMGQREVEKRLRPPPPRPAPAFSPQMRGSGTGSAKKAPSSQGNGKASSDHLAIPGYDALAASQVVPRLAGLSAEELEAVRAYEAATRHRRTILARIDQLQSAD